MLYCLHLDKYITSCQTYNLNSCQACRHTYVIKEFKHYPNTKYADFPTIRELSQPSIPQHIKEKINHGAK